MRKKAVYVPVLGLCLNLLWLCGCGSPAEPVVIPATGESPGIESSYEDESVTSPVSFDETKEESKASPGSFSETREESSAAPEEVNERQEDGFDSDSQVSEAPWEEPKQQESAGSFADRDCYAYSYQFLSEPEKVWYQNILDILGAFRTGVKLDAGPLSKGCDEETLKKVFQCVMDDHPELFYVEAFNYTKYTRGAVTTGFTFSGCYTISDTEAALRKQEIDKAAEQILSGIPEDADQYEKTEYVYETIIRNTVYDMAAPDNQSIYSVLVNHSSVCLGYARTVQYLLNKMGVNCAVVLGSTDTNQRHAWNLTEIDGAFYYLDATWGDGNPQTADENAVEMIYDYLNLTTAELEQTHVPNGETPLPVCDSREANYYTRHGALFSSYDEEQLERLLVSEEDMVTLKCLTADCYEEMKNKLISEGALFQFLPDSGKKVTYTQNDALMILTFWMTNS